MLKQESRCSIEKLSIGDLSSFVGAMLANAQVATNALDTFSTATQDDPGDCDVTISKEGFQPAETFVVNLHALADTTESDERRLSRRPYSYYMATQFHPVDEETLIDCDDANDDYVDLEQSSSTREANGESSSSSFTAHTSFASTLPRRFVQHCLNRTNHSTKSTFSLGFMRRLFAAGTRPASSSSSFSSACNREASIDEEASMRRLGLHRFLFGGSQPLARQAKQLHHATESADSSLQSAANSLLLLTAASSGVSAASEIRSNTCSSASSSSHSSSDDSESTSSRCAIEISTGNPSATISSLAGICAHSYIHL